jgi:hypothetical protein
MKIFVSVWEESPTPNPQTVTKIFDANDSEMFDAVSYCVSLFLHSLCYDRDFTCCMLQSLHKHFTVTQNG